MTPSHRLIAVWLALLTLFAALTVGAVGETRDVGLFGQRPPLTQLGILLRIAFLLGALTMVVRRRDVLERVTLRIGAAAAGSSALYGVGMRSPALSALRLLSHLTV